MSRGAIRDTVTTVFPYGTLRDPAHLSAVLGREDWRAGPVGLAGHAVRWDAAGEIPVIASAPGEKAEGIALEATDEDLARLDYYELPFGYRREDVTLTDARPAIAYFPDDPARAGAKAFDLADWEARFGALATASAEEVMADFGRKPAPAEGYRRNLARGWSRVLAERSTDATQVRQSLGREGVDEHSRERIHTGFFALDRYRLAHRAFAGGNVEVTREVFRSYDAALVLPYDPARDRIALIEQFRIGPYGRGDPRPWVLEPVAGLVDPGESPEDCAMREAEEEAGLTLSRLVPVMSGYASPGGTTEFFHLFVGLCDLPDGAGAGDRGGLDVEGEDIRTHILPLDVALNLIGTGEANVVPLAFLITWAAAQRARLQALAGVRPAGSLVRSDFTGGPPHEPETRPARCRRKDAADPPERSVGGDGMRDPGQGGIPQSRPVGQGSRGALDHP
jgi:ADP-ribose pyrophosphatase